MNIVPANKSDLVACNNLTNATDEEVKDKINELLEWVQDMNWPVAPLVCERLKVIGNPLIEPVTNILRGSDEIWKYWIISGLLRKTSNETLYLFKKELEDIVENPQKLKKPKKLI